MHAIITIMTIAGVIIMLYLLAKKAPKIFWGIMDTAAICVASVIVLFIVSLLTDALFHMYHSYCGYLYDFSFMQPYRYQEPGTQCPDVIIG